MECEVRTIEAPLSRPFKISRSSLETLRALVLTLRDRGRFGVGEGSLPSPLDPRDLSLLCSKACEEMGDPWGAPPREILEKAQALLALAPLPLRTAFDIALHDLLGKVLSQPAHLLHGIPKGSHEIPWTVSLDLPPIMAREARAAWERGFRILKIKLGEARGDESRIREIRRALPEARLRADANEGWSPKEAWEMGEILFREGFEFVEQPVSRLDVKNLVELSRSYPIPIFADESVQGLEDLHRLLERGFAGGINVKVQKSGGILPTLDLLREARERGVPVQLGCNVETGIGIAASSHLLGLVDYADLDGNLLLERDPFPLLAASRREGLSGWWIETPEGPGLGRGE